MPCHYDHTPSNDCFINGFSPAVQITHKGNIEKSYKLKLGQKTFSFPEYRLIRTTWRKQIGFWSLVFCPPSVSLWFVSSFWYDTPMQKQYDVFVSYTCLFSNGVACWCWCSCWIQIWCSKSKSKSFPKRKLIVETSLLWNYHYDYVLSF